MATWYPFSNMTALDANSLQALPVAALVDEDKALGMYQGQLHVMEYDSTSTRTQSIPEVVTPDDGTGRWIRKDFDDLHTKNGFFDEDGVVPPTSSSISFDNGTRTFTITPTGTEFKFYVEGKAYISTGDSVAITDVEGLHWIYFDNDGDLKSAAPGGFTQAAIILLKCSVGAIHWDATNKVAIAVGDERHGHIMSPVTHYHFHSTFGSLWESGGALGNFDLGGTGTDANAQFSISACEIHDEDLEYSVSHGNPQNINLPAEIPILYKSGASGLWRKVTADTFPVADDGSTIQWNEWTGATWQLTTATNNKFVLYHYFITNDINEPFFAIPGEDEYLNAPAAQAGAEVELNNLNTSGLPMPEIVALGTVIFKVDTGAANAVNAVVVATADGGNYIDWRETNIIGSSTGSVDHEALTGLLGGAASDHYHLTQIQHDKLTDGVQDADALHLHALADAHIAAAKPHTGHVDTDDLLNSSAGAGDAGKPIKLDADGNIDATMINDGDIDHTGITNIGTNSHADIDTHISAANPHSGHVDTTGNETIAGEKTFSTFPITPSAAPDADYEVANKKYVDDEVDGATAATKKYEKQAGSDGATSNTVFTISGFTYTTGNNTLVVYVNGQKAEKVTTATDETEYEETSTSSVTFGAPLLDEDVVEFYIHGNYTITDSDNFIPTSEKANKNKLINGNFNVWQRGTSFDSTTTPANSDDTYLADRWILLSDGNDIVDVSKQTDGGVDGETPYIRMDVETVSKKFGILQVIENVNCQKAIGGTVSLSFDCKVTNDTKLSDIRAVVLAWDSTADTVTSDIISAWAAEGTNPTLVANWTAENTAANLLVDTTWTRYKIENISVDTASTTNIAVFIYQNNVATNDTAGIFLEVTNVQLEVHDEATPFEDRSFQEEIALCERYFEKSYPMDTAPGTAEGSTDGRHVVGWGWNASAAQRYMVEFRVRKRTAATCTVYALDGTSNRVWFNSSGNTAPSSTNGQVNGFYLVITPTADDYVMFKWKADAEL